MDYSHLFVHEMIFYRFNNGSLTIRRPRYKELFIATVDGVHFRIWEPRKFPSTKWYSPKYKKAALTYEIGVAINHNKVVWVNEPFPAGENDKTVFDKPDGLRSKLKEGQLLLGDQGYRGSR